MSRQLERMLQIDDLIRRPERQTASTLAAAIEFSERTIRDDIAFMRDRHGAPIEFKRDRGYYYSDPDWRLPTIPLTKGELFALTLGARMLEAYAGSSYALELRSAVDRLAKRLPEESWLSLQQVADTQLLFGAGIETNLDLDIWNQLEDACRKSKQVWMRYYTASRNADSERILDPYVLHIYRGTNPYVIGWCHARQAVRWFRVDRIRALKRLEDSFKRRPEFNAQEHLESIFQHEVGEKEVSVRIWFDPQTAPYIRERQWHRSQQLEDHGDGSVTLQMLVRGLNDLKRWVLGYGRGAKVLEPPELVALVKAEIAGMAGHYGSPIPESLDGGY